ncbi:MAG: hypothetical protein JWL70_3160 [Acidimicrobiia bacterium]|nr:hypothetical protein [Acidimicrobiia bacterium]
MLVTAVVAVAALGAAAFAVTNVGGSASGSSSPDAAVQKLLDAASHEDILGALDTLPPGERDSFKQPLIDLVKELKRIGILSADAKLDAVKGAEINFSDVKTQSTNVGDGKNVVSVALTGGKATLGFDPAKIPLGDFLVQKILKGKRPTGNSGTTTHTITGDENIKIATVKVDGDWYVSLWYTVAEAARTGAGLPVPDFGHPIANGGADSPEGAVQALAKAASQLDVRRIIELTPPDEARVLHDYGPLFLGKAEAAIKDLKSKNDFTIDEPKLTLTSSGSGDRRTVAVKAATVSGTLKGDPFSASTDGKCFTLKAPNQPENKSCCGDPKNQLNSLGLGSLNFLNDLHIDSGVAVVQVDGKWYVSPTHTLTDVLVNVLKALDQDKINKLIDGFSTLTQSPLLRDAQRLGSGGSESPTTRVGSTSTTESSPESSVAPSTSAP